MPQTQLWCGLRVHRRVWKNKNFFTGKNGSVEQGRFYTESFSVSTRHCELFSELAVNVCADIADDVLQTGGCVLQSLFDFIDAVKHCGVILTEFLADFRQGK